jgi:hypothetical protein
MIISVLAYNEPYYLARTLDALKRCSGIEKCQLLVYQHTNLYPNVRKIAELFDACPRYVIVGPTVGGKPYERVSQATKACLDLAFGLDDFVIHLEHDDLLAPDALSWFSKMKIRYAKVPSVISIGAFNHSSESDLTKPNENMLDTLFVTHGWATWRDRWKVLREDWGSEWDRHINNRHMRGHVQVRPWLSRSTNIGADAEGACGESREWRRANMSPAAWSGDIWRN